MWLLDKKKGVSIMVGYVLLVTCAIIMGVLVYQWIKTYVPADPLEGPEGVSIFIKEYNYDCSTSKLNITLKNNGLFNIAGYFIHATNNSNQTLATIDLSSYTALGEGKAGTVLFDIKNSFKPNDEKTNTFDLSGSGIGQIYSIEVIPVRFQEEEGKERFVSCGGSKVGEMLSCYECVPDTCVDLGYECGIWENNGCGEELDCDAEIGCEGGEFCNVGTCEEIPGTCEDGLGTCDTGETCLNCPGDCEPCCGNDLCAIIDPSETCLNCPFDCNFGDFWQPCCGNGLCAIIDTSETCGDDDNAPACNSDCGICCGNGVLDTGERCDDGDNDDGDGCSSTCTIELGWNCTGEPSACYICNNNLICDIGEGCLCLDCENKKDGCGDGLACQDGVCAPVTSVDSCKSYCFYLGYDDTLSHCANNCGGACEGTCETGGDEYCSAPMDYCCCVPL